MTDGDEYPMKAVAWMGPKQMTDEGTQLQAIVTEDYDGSFWAGTRYRYEDADITDVGYEDIFECDTYQAKDAAIFAARTMTNKEIQSANWHARRVRLLQRRARNKGLRENAAGEKRLRLVIDR